jgi:predicted O-linked N-acetylglucosamine transferase (SPINDLY family)
VFAPHLPQEQHLGRLGVADLCLDTFPYNAHTATSDALWAGVPIVTRPGETFASRVAGALLTAAGAPELVAGSVAEYEALAIGLARDPARLGALRAKLERTRAGAALFDTPRFVSSLETAYQRMWERFLEGEPPARIDL